MQLASTSRSLSRDAAQKQKGFVVESPADRKNVHTVHMEPRAEYWPRSSMLVTRSARKAIGMLFIGRRTLYPHLDQEDCTSY